MASLFQGSPQQAPSYTTSTTETPKWMQDAIYNQIQWAQNIANKPFQPYSLPTVAEQDVAQRTAYQQATQNVGAWQPAFSAAQSGLQQLAGATPSAGAAQPYANLQQQVLGGIDYNAPVSSLQPYVSQAAGMSGVSAAQPYANQAYNLAMQGAGGTTGQLRADQAAALQQGALTAASPYFGQAGAGYQRAAATDTAGRLAAEQGRYMRPDLAGQGLAAGQQLLGRAAGMDIAGAAQPLLGRSAQATEQTMAERALAAAQPYMQAAGRSAAQDVSTYMSPYTEGVTQQIAKMGARNLRENLLPQVAESFIRAGQFGSGRMGEFGSRALRDTQEAVLREQSQALQQGYGQALSAAQADLARQAQLAGTAGGIAGADLSRMLQGAGQFGQLGQTAGQLTGQQMQQLAALGQAQTAAGQAQQQVGMQAAQAAQAAQTADAARALQAAQAQAALGQTAGQFQGQQQAAMLNAAQAAQAAQAADYARQMQAGQQVGALGQMMGGLTQQQQQALLSAGQALSGAQQQAAAQRLAGAGQYGQLAATMGGFGGADAARQLSALQQMAGMAQQGQALRSADVAALEAAGLTRQQQAQRTLDAARQQFMEQQMYPRQQLDWLSTQVRGMAPITPQTTTQQGYTTQFAPSPLSQLASGLFAYQGLNRLGT